MHGGEAEQRMLDVVAGQDRNRPLGRQVALQQRRGDGANGRECLRIAQRAPRAGRVALRKEDTIGRGLGPMHQPLREIFGIRRQRMRRAHQDGAVLAPFDQHIGRPELYRPQRRAFILHLRSANHFAFSSAPLWGRVFPKTPSGAPWLPRRPGRCRRRALRWRNPWPDRCGRCEAATASPRNW